jgi:opacity protein-like surface antigen
MQIRFILSNLHVEGEMKGPFIIVIGGFLLVLGVSQAFALPKPFYASIHAGGCFLEDADLAGNFDSVRLNYDPGPVVTGALGYDFIGARIEGEIGYRDNGINKIDYQGHSSYPGGDVSVLSFMANGIADFPLHSPFHPYVNAGIGLALVSINEDQSLSLDLDSTDDTVFAYQGGAGVGYAVTPEWTVEIGYEYFATLNPKFKTTDGDGVDFSYASHSAMVGVRYGF